MNLFKKGIFALLIGGLVVVSCEDDDFENATGTGLTEITFSSFEATPGPDENGFEDGTYITVKPLAIGVDFYEVDFGIEGGTGIIEPGGSTSFDYPNELTEATYTITVTAKSDKGLADVMKSKAITVEHEVTTVSSSPGSPIILDENVYAIFSDGMESNGGFTAYSNKSSSSNFDASAAVEYNEVAVGDIKNNVIQYSRLHSPNAASITFDTPIIIADVFGTGASADYIHLDLHSIHDIGVDKVKITLGGRTFEQSLTNDMWTGVEFEFFMEGITQIDEITLELGTGGIANNEASLHVDNIYLYRDPLSIPEFTVDEVLSDFDVTFTNASELATSYSWDFGDGVGTSTEEDPTYSYTNDGLEKTYMVTLTTTNSRNKTTSVTKEVIVGGSDGPIYPEIAWGHFNGGSSDVYGPWKIANTTGSSNPFSGSSDGSCLNYDGSDNGSKTRGAKWSSSQSANPDGTAVEGNTRYAYQAVTLSPNTDYIFEFEYAIKTGGSETNSIVAAILNAHFSDSADAVASNPLAEHVGTEAKGKFADNSCSGGTSVKLPFRSNSVGEVSIFIYAVTDVDAFVDNVKVYPAE